jgi:ABC-type lipoprotein release transport system permease subunit
MIDTFKIIILIATRNLLASRLKTIIVGGIIFFGAFLVVLGTSLLGSVTSAMSRSIIGSIAGNIQVYSAKSKDPLEVVGGFSMDGADIDELDDFAKVRATLMKVPNVKDVVPMGISGAIVSSGNSFDIALADLRDLVRQRRSKGASAELDASIADKRDHVRQMITVLQGDLANFTQIQNEKAYEPEDIEAVKKAAAPEFWAEFDRDPLAALEFLENRIAPQATDADMLFLRYVGTDPAAFARSFDRMKIVDGTAIPRGERGFMFAKYTYEDQLKLKTARRLDKMKIAIENRGSTIAKDAEMQQFVRDNSAQVRELILQLDGRKTALFRKKLQEKLGGPLATETDVAKLLSSFFKMDDGNFYDRYKFFYEQLAPSLDLYRVRVGDTLTIKAFTKSGYVQSINLKVYGTFTFNGLEQSAEAGQLNLMDLVSFRDLYGYLTDDKRAEIAALKANANTRDLSRDNAEAELFGTKTAEPETAAPGRTVTLDATPGANPDEALAGLAGRLQREELAHRVYDPSQLEGGIVLNAAVLLKDPKKLEQSIKDIEAAGKEAGLPLKAISWQAASGFIGQFANLAALVLATAMLIIFVVALVIINNALVMATLERVKEIGTLRAVGAQRRFILGMLVVEALAIGALFGALGTAVGAGFIALLGKIGIPSANDVMTFFFSGPRLFPEIGASSLVGALVIVLFVSALSSLYPAWLAMRVTPRQAMQTEE